MLAQFNGKHEAAAKSVTAPLAAEDLEKSAEKK
jgi:hypothetical protein